MINKNTKAHVFIVEGDIVMPVRKLTINGETFYQWGTSGKMYKKREDAEKQGYAIEQQGYKPKRKGK
jgi:hypothetical protein